MVSKIDALWGGKAWKDKRRKKEVGERGSLVLDHGSICLETAPGGAGSREGSPALAHPCPAGAPVGAQCCHKPGWRFSSRSPALEAFKDSLPMHRSGHGSPPNTTPGTTLLQAEPHPKCEAQPGLSSDAPSTSSNSHNLPQHLPAAHPWPRTPTGHRQGHPGLPQSVWRTYIYTDIKEIALIRGEKGETWFANKSSTGDR